MTDNQDRYARVTCDKITFTNCHEESLRDALKQRVHFATERTWRQTIETRLLVELVGKLINDTVTAELTHPRDWVESLKERFLPAFIWRWWPVKTLTSTAEVSRYVICPHLVTDPARKHYQFLYHHIPGASDAQDLPDRQSHR